MLGGLANQLTRSESLDEQAYGYFCTVTEQADLIYKREPKYASAMFGLSKRYEGSVVTTDKVSEFFAAKSRSTSERPAPRPPRTAVVPPTPSAVANGFCIRTGAHIPFNTKHPMSAEAFRSWERYKDESYKEKFCHFSGEPSNGETSFARPILKKNWSKAKSTFDL